MTSLTAIVNTITRIAEALPVALLVVTFSWSFWAYIDKLCITLIKEGNKLQGFLYILFFIPIFVLCVWTYCVVCRTSPGHTSNIRQQEEDSVGLLSHMTPFDLEEEQVYHSPTPITVKRDGEKRYCKKCKLDKFDRTHHCRHCKKCVLKMDHHCPWINNCVGFQNYKAFYLFLVYASLYCVYVFSTVLPPVIVQLNKPIGLLGLSINCAVLVFISAVFGLFLVPFTVFHTRQLCRNQTTIEYYEKSNYRIKSKELARQKYFNPWDLGTRKNIEQVLGKGPLWQKLLPMGLPLGDGTSFPIHSNAYDTIIED